MNVRALRELAKAGLIFVSLAALLALPSIGCPIKFLTGLSCPGCGLTRAWLEALSLHPLQALSYHPLFWLVPLAFIALALLRKPSLSLFCNGFLAFCGLAFISLWLLRLATDGDASMPWATNGSFAMLDIVNWQPPAWANVLSH